MYCCDSLIVISVNYHTFLTAASVSHVRPQTTVSQAVTGGVQNVQIIQGPNGQLQVRGLMPGKSFDNDTISALGKKTLPECMLIIIFVNKTTCWSACTIKFICLMWHVS